jgi:dipeptidase D
MFNERLLLDKLKPKEFWENFAAVCKIPHPSGQEQKLCGFIKDFAENLGLETLVDEVGNLLVKKPATAGMEKRRGVILQAHLDMVPEKNEDIKHDFAVDPIKPYIDGDWVKAEGTTLGADDGFGIASIMAALQSKTLRHGPLEALFTVDEEVNFTGAYNIKPGLLSGEILLNLDSDIEGEITIGSAGGVFIDGIFAYNKIPVSQKAKTFMIKVHGLKGGHSSIEIDKPLANAIKVIGRLLYLAKQKFDLNLIALNSGSAYNAIARKAEALVAVAPEQVEELRHFIMAHRKFLAENFLELKDLAIELTSKPDQDWVMDPKNQEILLNIIYACPHGILGMSKDIPDLIETSANLAMIVTEENNFKISVFPRSAISFLLDNTANTISCLFKLAAVEVKLFNRYPAWQPKPALPIIELASQIYEKKFGIKPKITAIHGGLECGIFVIANPNLEMISIGTNIEQAHSPNERLSISSVNRYWEFLTALLANIPQKNS